MDEELVDLARQYAVPRGITLHERLGFGINGTVFAAADNAKPGEVAFHVLPNFPRLPRVSSGNADGFGAGPGRSRS